MIKQVTDLDVAGKRVLVRVDFNVPQDEHGVITDDTRIVESLPTLKNIVSRGGTAIVMSHLGRPKGKVNPQYSLKPIADHLRTLLTVPVAFSDTCIGEGAAAAVAAAPSGSIVVLENLRFHAEEEANDPSFAGALAALGDAYVNDAFGTAHRAHASTEGVAHHVAEKAAGLLMVKEIEYLGTALDAPKRPLVAVMGGSKISGKIDVITALLSKCDAILIGGGMMFTFLKAQGIDVGASLVEEDKVGLAAQIMQDAAAKNVRLLIPQDTVAASAFNNDAERTTVSVNAISSGWMGLDIGPETIDAYTREIVQAGTVVWNGPMGVFEMSNFAAGTEAVARALATATSGGTITIVGGGDSAAAIALFGLKDAVTHVSTGGGASLEFLEGKPLPGVVALETT